MVSVIGRRVDDVRKPKKLVSGKAIALDRLPVERNHRPQDKLADPLSSKVAASRVCMTKAFDYCSNKYRE